MYRPGTEPCCAGMLACWNHPFEVARIEAQARGDQNQKDLNMVQIFRMIVKEQVIHWKLFTVSSCLQMRSAH